MPKSKHTIAATNACVIKNIVMKETFFSYKNKSVILPVEVKGKLVFVNLTLSEHPVEDGLNLIYRDSWVAHSEDSIKFSSNKGNARLFHSLSKRLQF